MSRAGFAYLETEYLACLLLEVILIQCTTNEIVCRVLSQTNSPGTKH